MRKSLDEVHGTIKVYAGLSKLKKLLSFAGPGYLIAVGYMDPGNWATDLAGGSKFGYQLLFVILISNFMAILLQHLALKLGIVTGRDLAQACHDYYSSKTRFFLWIMAEIAITACDLAEVIGSAIALNLLFGIPILAGVIITSLDALIILFLQNKGLRYLEAFVIILISIIVICFGLEIWFSHPELASVLRGFVPTLDLFKNKEMMYVAVGILGATVMPHNLYLHSALVQSRNFKKTISGRKEAILYATIDSTIALCIATFVNAAILIISAAVFFTRGLGDVVEIQQAYHLLTPLLGAQVASVLFALALLASGHNSTITGTMAGQVVMEGFVDIRIKPWQRRLLTRMLAIIPAIFIIIISGTQGLAKLLVFSQVVLSMQLPFAVIPLVNFTSQSKYMGRFVNSRRIKFISWIVAGIITILNIWLIIQVLWAN